jgi:DnaK suppressor protein
METNTITGMSMNKAELEGYKASLVELRDRHNRDASHLADEALRRSGGGAANLSNMPIHMADLGTDNYEQEFTLGLLQNEEQLLEEVSAALERIEQGTYGRCEECQEMIPKPRMHAVPYARYCVECARKQEENS